MKTILLVMSSSTNVIYKKLENSIKETWYKFKNNEFDIIFYKDSQLNTAEFDGCDLHLPVEDGYENLGKKTILAMDWVNQNYRYDYIYRSNLGSFINVENMKKFLQDKPKEKFYCGIIGKYIINNICFNFASGSGYFLSKDLVDIISKNINDYPDQIVDDVAMGYFLSKFNININKNATRKNMCDDQIFYEKGSENIPYILDEEIYHIRLRSENRSIDIKRMHDLFNKV